MPNLPVGDELNALLHEHVFGGKIMSLEYMEAEAEKVWKEQPMCCVFHEFVFCIVNGEFTFKQKMPNYLDGNGMLKVVAAMKEKGYWRRVFDSEEGTIVAFHSFKLPREGVSAEHDHEPTACGQSALLAIGAIK